MLDLQANPVRPLDPRALSCIRGPRHSCANLRFLWVLGVACGCAARPANAPQALVAAAQPSTHAPPAAAAVQQAPVRLDAAAVAAPSDDLGLEILRPSGQSTDDEVARVGPHAVAKRHVHDRLLETNPQQARELVDSVVLDLLIAGFAEEYGVRLSAADVEPKLAEEEKQLRERLAAEWKGQLDYERYLLQQFGMDAAEYHRWRRITLARTLYRQYVIRYHAMRGARVQVRYIVTSDRSALEDVRKQIKDGASFSRLALRWSEDDARKEGGLLPPFGPGLDHPIAEVALAMDAGDLSEVIEREVDGQKRFYLVSCLRRIPAETRPFAEVRAEIEEDIKARPLSRFDFHCFYFQARGASESPRNAETGR